MEYREFRAMNSHIVLAAEGSHGAVKRGFDRAEALVRALEQRFTRFSETSELARLNRAAGSNCTSAHAAAGRLTSDGRRVTPSARISSMLRS